MQLRRRLATAIAVSLVMPGALVAQGGAEEPATVAEFAAAVAHAEEVATGRDAEATQAAVMRALAIARRVGSEGLRTESGQASLWSRARRVQPSRLHSQRQLAAA